MLMQHTNMLMAYDIKDNLLFNPQEGKIIHARKLPREQNQQT